MEVAALAIARVIHDRTPEEIAADYDISLAQVHAALSYYYAHKAEIDASIRQQADLARELKEELIAQGYTPLLGRKSQS